MDLGVDGDDTAGRGPRRRPETGGYARGEEVRTRILLAAIRLFGDRGFVRTSTREIAASAGVNPPALQYYFNNKEGLHQACEQYIADGIGARLHVPMTAASQLLARGERDGVNDVLWPLVDAVVDHFSRDDDIPGWAQFLFRAATEQADKGPRLLRLHAINPLFVMFADLIALRWGRTGDDETARMAAVLLLNQIGALGVGRRDTLVRMGWPDFGGERLALGKRFLQQHITAVLASPPA